MFKVMKKMEMKILIMDIMRIVEKKIILNIQKILIVQKLILIENITKIKVKI